MTATPEHLHSALTYCTDFAKTMLEKAGAFHPFGAFINADGKVEAVGAWTGDEYPKGQEVYQLLMDGLRNQLKEGSALAIAVATDVNIPQEYEAGQNDGVRITLEASGYSRFIYFPYRLERKGLLGLKKSAVLLEPFAVELTPPC